MSDDPDQPRLHDRGADATGSLAEERIDELLDALADEHRRRLVARLARADGDALTVDEVVRDLSADVDLPREHLRIALLHNHIPKLDSVGLVDLDVAAETVTYTGGPVAETVLRAVESRAETRY